MVSDTVVNEFIRSWKRSVFGHQPSWPSESVIAKIVKYMTRLDRSPVISDSLDDGEVLAQIVSEMRDEDKEAYDCFIAFHLAVITDERHTDKKHRQRAEILGIADRTYRRRKARGFEFCRQRLSKRLALEAASMV